MFSAFCSHIITQKSKINSINVFPVPDQDTGSNLASTFEKVKKELDRHKFSTIQALSDSIGKTSLYAAQGNSGIIYTGFIAGFFDALTSDSNKMTSEVICNAFREGTKKAYSSIEVPQKGTILDVMDAVVVCMESECKKKDCSIEEMFRLSFIAGKKALDNTKQQMAVLRESDVVDAGGLAFVMMLESFYECLTGKKLDISQESEVVILKNGSSSITSNRYEVVFILKDSLLIPADIKDMFSELGDSMDIVEVSDAIKFHIHTDQPQIVKEIALSLGTIVFLQIMDMKEEKVLELIEIE
ncbi:MAG: DAK2 domain-containing protein [Patescibacteria group bacterium]